MKKTVLILLAILFVQITVCHANDTKDLVKKIKNIESMDASFIQKTMDMKNHRVINSKGIVQIQKPNLFKWKTTSPNEQEIFSDGKRIWIYDIDLDQVLIKKISNDITELPYLILLSTNEKNINKSFIVTKKDKNTYLLKNIDNGVLKSIKIIFNNEDKLKSLHVLTYMNQLTKIFFYDISDAKSNKNIITLDLPKNIDVINANE